MDWTVNRGLRTLIKLDLELIRENIRQLLLFAKAMSRLIELDSSNALNPYQKEKLDALDAFPESNISGDVLCTMLRKKANSAESRFRVVHKERKC